MGICDPSGGTPSASDESTWTRHLQHVAQGRLGRCRHLVEYILAQGSLSFETSSSGGGGLDECKAEGICGSIRPRHNPIHTGTEAVWGRADAAVGRAGRNANSSLHR
jgi:hypothetical protein